MFVLTMSGKRALRAALIILAVFIGVAVGIAAVLTSINTGASETRLPIYSVERNDNKIALSFNCAWGNSNTDELLAILDEHNVFATFFITGEFSEKFPDDVRKIMNAGHEIGNHSDAHPHLKGMNINKIIEDTRESERKIMMITGSRPALYRAPYGEYDANALKTIEGLGYNFIQWSVDSIDWQEPDPATIVKRVTDKTDSGSILLFHNDLENTTEALPEILTKLRQGGFQFVRVGDLIYNEDYHIDHSGRQIRDVKTIIPVSGNDSENTGNIPNFPELGNPLLNEAIAIIVSNLSLEEIASLSHGLSEIPQEITDKLAPHLSSEHIAALSELTAEETEALIAAILAAENRVTPDFNQKDGYSEIEHSGESFNAEEFEFEKGEDYENVEGLEQEIEEESGFEREAIEQFFDMSGQNEQNMQNNQMNAGQVERLAEDYFVKD
ncbi:MAG: polysaccharide deacetylase family protein [Oscillospiraceae bacterium]|nr:polysaccharide deacetylase family protein [Oscillospiraceae bacterium]